MLNPLLHNQMKHLVMYFEVFDIAKRSIVLKICVLVG